MKKRALYWILSIMLVLSMVGMVACGKSDKPPKAEVKVTLSQSAATIGLFDTLALTATKENTGEVVVWSSSNSAVASVDRDGFVTPKKVGTATITASVADASASCEVTITAPGEGSLLVDAGKVSQKLKIGESIINATSATTKSIAALKPL